MLWAWVIAQAAGAGFYLESQHVQTRDEVVGLEQAAAQAGHTAQIVRRFVDGQGWRFLIRLDGFDELGAAEAAAASLAVTLGRAVDLLQIDGAEARLVRRQDPGDPVPVSPNEEPTEMGRQAWTVLERAAAAHGVDRDTLTRWMAGPTHLEYRRTLGDGTVVDHGWWTRDGATYVTVQAVQGKASSSRVFVGPEKAWLAIGDRGWQEQSVARAAVVVRDLGPSAVIPVVLGLRQAMETRPEFADMQYAGEGEVDGDPVHVLGYGGDSAAPAMVIEVTQANDWIRRVSFAGGEVVHEFADFRTVGDMVLPYRVRSTRPGGVVDVVAIAVVRSGEDALDDAFVIAADAASPPP